MLQSLCLFANCVIQKCECVRMNKMHTSRVVHKSIVNVKCRVSSVAPLVFFFVFVVHTFSSKLWNYTVLATSHTRNVISREQTYTGQHKSSFLCYIKFKALILKIIIKELYKYFYKSTVFHKFPIFRNCCCLEIHTERVCIIFITFNFW